jgi:hypothetical protein
VLDLDELLVVKGVTPANYGERSVAPSRPTAPPPEGVIHGSFEPVGNVNTASPTVFQLLTPEIDAVTAAAIVREERS